MTISTYIIDDEQHAIDILRKYINATPGLSLQGFSQLPQHSLSVIVSPQPPALTFLDIDMPLISGIELANLIGQHTALVFTTSHRQYGVEAFEKNAVDYLLKPFSYERFLAAVQKFKERKLQSGLYMPPDDVFVNGGVKGRLVRVPLNELVIVEGAQNYINLVLADGKKIMTYLRMQEFLDSLPQNRFCRVHKSYAVNLSRLSTIEASRVIMDTLAEIPIGRTYIATFQAALQGRILGGNRSQEG